MNPFASPLARLRLVGAAEGTSYLVLLVASAVKRALGYADPVFVVGTVHGALFVAFALCVLEVAVRRPWWSARFWIYAALAAIIPAGTFVFDRWLVRAEKQPI